MAHRHNFCISSQMKFKFKSDIMWVMFTSNSGKADNIIIHLFRFDKNASSHCFWSGTISIDGYHGNKKRSILELLCLKDSPI